MSQPSQAMDRFVEVLPVGQASRGQSAVSVRVTYETSATRFVQEAKRFHNRDEKSARLVPFMQYWPTYSVMTEDQKRWYFYWRSQARQNNFLSTDLSYIFVHIYELLNLVETPGPEAAAGRLWTLWQHYRVDHPKLDNYLPDWGGDLLAVHKDVRAGLDWWERALQQAGRPSEPLLNVIMQQYVDSRRSAEMPYWLWSRLTDYRPRNKFYQAHNQDGAIDRAYERAIRVADDYWRHTAGQSVLEQFTSKQQRMIRKPVFTSAVIGYEHPETVTLGQGRNYLGEARLNDHLTSVVKYAENVLRKQMKFGRQLSGVQLENSLAQALAAALAPEQPRPEPVRVTLDPARVAALQQESALIGALLGENQPGDQKPADKKPLYTDLTEMRQLWGELAPIDRLVAADIFRASVLNVEQLHSRLSPFALLPNMVIDRINDKALQFLGDRLVYIDAGGALSLAEDFTDELDVVLREFPAELPKAAPAQSSRPAAGSGDDAWDRVLSQLSQVEVGLITLFAAQGRLTDAELESAARPYNMMANAALDALNEKAVEHLGHPPIYFESSSWFIEAEDLVVLRRHLSPPGAD